MDPKALADLEFDQVLKLLKAETRTPLGSAAAPKVVPTSDPDRVVREQRLTAEAMQYADDHGVLPFGDLTDPEPSLLHLAVEGSDGTPAEVLELLQLMKSGRDVKSALALSRGQFPLLWEVARDLPDLGNLIRFLDGKIGPQGDVLDHASDDLLAVRRDLRGAGVRLDELLADIVARPEIARVLQDDFVSLRSDRHVIPIRSESRQALAGIVHGVSGTGATVFVEPLETVELNNEVVTLRERESAEVRRLLREYSELLRGRLPEIRALAQGLGRLDVVQARGLLGRRMRATMADISPRGVLRLIAARHPLVEASLEAQGGDIVPLDIELDDGAQVLLLSGPNTGGKTIALKTVGLLVLMHQAGLLVPARHASLPVFAAVFIDIGDRQSIHDRLSTFSARMRTIASMARDFTLPCLILLDEVGTGTDPEEGVALAIAIVDYFRARGARLLATTHLEALKAYAATTTACSNAAMQFDEATGEPTYRLVLGIPGRSSALEIAAHLGLPETIVEDARARRGGAKGMLDRYLSRLDQLTADLAARLAETEQIKTGLASEKEAVARDLEAREKQLRDAVAKEIELAVGSIRDEGERYLSGLKEREVAVRMRAEESKLAARLRSEARHQLRSVAKKADPEEPVDEVRIGDRVRLRGLGVPGNVQELLGDRVAVLVRGKRVVVPLADCERLEESGGDSKAGPAVLPKGVTFKRRDVPSATDIDLRGLLVDEALAKVDKFLDDATLESLGRVRLVHGVGSGRLRQAIRQLLETHPQVDGFGPAPEDEGGQGATIVTLRG